MVNKLQLFCPRLITIAVQTPNSVVGVNLNHELIFKILINDICNPLSGSMSKINVLAGQMLIFKMKIQAPKF